MFIVGVAHICIWDNKMSILKKISTLSWIRYYHLSMT